MDKYFADERHAADTTGPELNLRWFERMKTVFYEIERTLGCVPSEEHIRFLNLG